MKVARHSASRLRVGEESLSYARTREVRLRVGEIGFDVGGMSAANVAYS